MIKRYGYRDQSQPVVIETSVYKKLMEKNIPNITYFVSRAIEDKLSKAEYIVPKIKIKQSDEKPCFIRIEKPIYDQLNWLEIKNISNYISRAIEENLN